MQQTNWGLNTAIASDDLFEAGRRVILILGLVSPECSTCSQIVINNHAIPKTPDLICWIEF